MRAVKNVSVWALVGAIVLSGCAGSSSRLKNAAQKNDEIVEAEGIVPYKADDLPGTKAGALAAAQRSAVELVVGVYVSARTRVDKAVTIEQKILAQTSGYVKKYDILSEGRDGEWYKTRIRALVSTKALHEELDNLGLLLGPAVGNPRVAFLISEWAGENKDDAKPATQALSQELINRGFKVVELPASVHSDDDAAEVARGLSRGNCELLIAGLARAQSMEMDARLGGMASYRASISLRVLEVGTGEVITTVSDTASGLEANAQLAADKALSNAAQSVAKQLYSLPQELDKRSHVTVTINGITSFAVLAHLQTELPKVTGVRDVFMRSFDQSQGMAVLDVQVTAIGPQALAEAAVKIGGDTWSVYQVAGYSVQLSASLAGH